LNIFKRERETTMSENPDFNTSSHSNQVQITSSLITAMSYSTFFDITPGQPSTLPPTASQNGSTWTITINCGRKGSSGVATSFDNAVLGGDSNGQSAFHEYAPSGGGGTPDDLNFCFGMNVTFTVNKTAIETTLYFAQGNYGTTNNWWIGGNALLNHSGDPMLVLISSDSVMEVLTVSGGVSSFTLSDVSASAASAA
jgi:hypothetical protein